MGETGQEKESGGAKEDGMAEDEDFEVPAEPLGSGLVPAATGENHWSLTRRVAWRSAGLDVEVFDVSILVNSLAYL